MKSNIVLIGMMGSGKTTLGGRLSEVLSMPFIDVDQEIEKHYGSINKLFEKGEEHFRAIESEMVKNLSMKDRVIISTGGGIVLRHQNMEVLKATGLVFYLVRPIEDIIQTVDASNRPLLKNGTDVLYRLEKERGPLYLKYSDHIIDASQPDKALLTIHSIWNNGL